MDKKIAKLVCLVLSATLCISVAAKGVYEEPAAFINRVFADDPPKPKKLWIKKEVKELINEILGHDLNVLRLRYWEKGGRTTWILEEIGRDQPITTGITVNDKKIEEMSVLIFRESRGWEIRYPFFTDQFRGVSIGDKKGLSDSIDGISGATLSVNAVSKLAQLALTLSQYVENKKQ